MSRELQKFNAYTTKCFKGDPPPCRCFCPFKLDVRSFTSKVARGNFNSAYREYRNTVVFPEIVSRICTAACEAVCVRAGNGGAAGVAGNGGIDGNAEVGGNGGAAVSLRGIEAACLKYSSDRKNVRYDIPPKEDRVAIVGAGPSGLACAMKLASRNFPVTVFHMGAEPGGSLEGSAAKDVYRAEIETMLEGLPIEFRPDAPLTAVSPLLEEGFRAVYVATGKGGDTFGLEDGADTDSLGSRIPGIFIGGEVMGASQAQAIENGSRASRSIEKYLQTGAMDGIPETFEAWQANKQYYRPIAEAPRGHTDDKEGAILEAGRCAACECSACIDACPMLQDAKRTPQKLSADVTATLNKIEQQTRRIANRLINSCNLCGLCREVCPVDVAIGECLLEARKELLRQGGMPPVFHEYYLKDLDHAMSDEAFFEYMPGAGAGEGQGVGEGRGAPADLFFPGCQSGASSPEYVIRPYMALCGAKGGGGAGILVACCGAPAEWAGDEGREEELLERIRQTWERGGKPTVVCSCLSCLGRFAEKLPEIPAITYFEWAARNGFAPQYIAEPLYLFDPCAARYADEAREAVRGLLDGAGIAFQTGKMSGALAECCGYGGHIYASNPALYDEVVSARIAESELPYVAYCTNCRDAFAAQGKACMHIFDLLFGTEADAEADEAATDARGKADAAKIAFEEAAERPAPRIEERRENRRRVKRRLSEICYMSTISRETNEDAFPELIVTAELEAKIEQELLSIRDVQMIIQSAEGTEVKLYDAQSGHFVAHGGVGASTCWVVYETAGGACRLVNVYAHRLRAVEGA